MDLHNPPSDYRLHPKDVGEKIDKPEVRPYFAQPPVQPSAEGTSVDAYYIAKCAREDAREASGRIIKHMWIIFVLLPVVIGILIALLK
jgi:hypothetical protein